MENVTTITLKFYVTVSIFSEGYSGQVLVNQTFLNGSKVSFNTGIQ